MPRNISRKGMPHDRVGTSYLEKNMRRNCKEKDTVREITVDKEGEVASDKNQPPARSVQSRLTIDL